MKLEAKKSVARECPVSNKTVNAVIAYQEKTNAKNEDIMFPGGDGKDPVNKWVKKVNKFFEKHGHPGVMSHNFRVTRATELYNKTKNIVKVKDWLGHSDVKITQRYIQVRKEETQRDVVDLFDEANKNQT